VKTRGQGTEGPRDRGTEGTSHKEKQWTEVESLRGSVRAVFCKRRVSMMADDAAIDEPTRGCESGLQRRFVEIDFDVVEVVLRVFADQGHVLVRDFAAKLGGNAGPEGARRNDGLLGDNGTGSDDAPLADASVVEHASAHADDDVVCDDAAVDGGVVADSDPVTNYDGIEIALAVENSAVLHVGAGADANEVDVAAQDCVHPHRGPLAEDHVAKDLRRWVDVATGGDFGENALIGSDHCGLNQECKAETEG